MSLDITPDTLKFPFELRKQIRCDLFLHNPGSSGMAFKVKTTAPKKYCVRPNIGIVAPGASIEVQVIMQSQKETPADLQQCKDKFLVQAVATGATDASELDSATFAKAEGKTISETKLRVAYTSPAVPPTVSEEEPTSVSAGADESAGAEGESMALKYERASKDLIAATNSYNASQADVSRLQREIADYKLQVTDLKSKVVSGEAEVATKAPTGFSLLHLLLVSIICFLIGRFM